MDSPTSVAATRKEYNGRDRKNAPSNHQDGSRLDSALSSNRYNTNDRHNTRRDRRHDNNYSERHYERGYRRDRSRSRDRHHHQHDNYSYDRHDDNRNHRGNELRPHYDDKHYQNRRDDFPRDYDNDRRYDRHIRNRNHQDRHQDRHQDHHPSNSSHESKELPLLPDPKLGILNDDPRPTNRITHKASSRGKGRNTESFDPRSTLVRPDLRIQIGSNSVDKYNKVLKHDDVVIVPELFGKEDDWDNYYQLVEEMRELQKKEQEQKGSSNSNRTRDRRGGGGSAEWISWHEGAHLISKNPTGSPLFQSITKRLCEYFHIDTNKPTGTRFNWYRDSKDWKPFHHDSAAFNAQRARNQNITVGVSFGAARELAFIRAKEDDNPISDDKCRLYFPQTNNGVFSFGRDANIRWKHGINALVPSEQDGKGRISIILWGFAKDIVEEEGSPPLLGSNGQGPHAAKGGRGRFDGGKRHSQDRNDRNGRHH